MSRARAIIRKQRPIVPRLVEIGRCYKGSPKGTSKRGYAGGDDYASHYFRFEPEQRLKMHPATNDSYASLHEELRASWEDLIGQGHIKIRFPHSTIEENFPYSNRVVKQVGGVPKTFRECDGEVCTKWTEDGKTPAGKTIPVFKRGEIACAATEGKACPMGCQAQGMLKFIVPDLYPGGMILFPLNSPVDITAIVGYLENYRQYDLSAIPFNLFRREDNISYEDKGEFNNRKNWGLHLAIDPTITRLMMQFKERQFVEILEGHPVQSLPATVKQIAPAREELPYFGKTDDGLSFTMKVQAAIRSGSLGQLEQAIADAEDLVYSGLYDRKSGIAFIDREATRAREAIRENPSFVPVEVIPQPASYVDRLKQVRAFTKHTTGQVKTICHRLGFTPEQATQNHEEFWQLTRSLLIDWGSKAPVWNHEKHCENSFDKLVDELPEDSKAGELESDRVLMEGWKAKIEAKGGQSPSLTPL